MKPLRKNQKIIALILILTIIPDIIFGVLYYQSVEHSKEFIYFNTEKTHSYNQTIELEYGHDYSGMFEFYSSDSGTVNLIGSVEISVNGSIIQRRSFNEQDEDYDDEGNPESVSITEEFKFNYTPKTNNEVMLVSVVVVIATSWSIVLYQDLSVEYLETQDFYETMGMMLLFSALFAGLFFFITFIGKSFQPNVFTTLPIKTKEEQMVIISEFNAKFNEYFICNDPNFSRMTIEQKHPYLMQRQNEFLDRMYRSGMQFTVEKGDLWHPGLGIIFQNAPTTHEQQEFVRLIELSHAIVNIYRWYKDYLLFGILGLLYGILLSIPFLKINIILFGIIFALAWVLLIYFCYKAYQDEKLLTLAKYVMSTTTIMNEQQKAFEYQMMLTIR